MIRSLVLFVHITGVLTMFAGLALEAFGGKPTGKAIPRIFGLAVPLTLLSGLYMGARFGVLADAWMCASYGAIAVMAARAAGAAIGRTAATVATSARGVRSGDRVLDGCEAGRGGVVDRLGPRPRHLGARRAANPGFPG